MEEEPPPGYELYENRDHDVGVLKSALFFRIFFGLAQCAMTARVPAAGMDWGARDMFFVGMLPIVAAFGPVTMHTAVRLLTLSHFALLALVAINLARMNENSIGPVFVGTLLVAYDARLIMVERESEARERERCESTKK